MISGEKTSRHRNTARLGQHAWTCDHRITWEHASIIDHCQNDPVRLVNEAFHIRLRPVHQRINGDTGVEVDEGWTRTLSKLLSN